MKNFTAGALFMIGAALSGMIIGLLLGMVIGAGAAHAGQVEQPDRQVSRVWVRYAEPVPTSTAPWRVYFETNDGAAYAYNGYRWCARANDVPNRVCRTVFWYAR